MDSKLAFEMGRKAAIKEINDNIDKYKDEILEYLLGKRSDLTQIMGVIVYPNDVCGFEDDFKNGIEAGAEEAIENMS